MQTHAKSDVISWWLYGIYIINEILILNMIVTVKHNIKWYDFSGCCAGGFHCVSIWFYVVVVVLNVFDRFINGSFIIASYIS